VNTTDLLRAVPDGVADGLADPHQQTRIVPRPLRTSFYCTRVMGIVIAVLVAVSLAVTIGAAVGISRCQTRKVAKAPPTSTFSGTSPIDDQPTPLSGVNPTSVGPDPVPSKA
jgi:hypothetical protein